MGMMLKYVYFILGIFGCLIPECSAQRFEVPPFEVKQMILDRINAVRSVERYCGRRYMAAAAPLTWNDKLYHSAFLHAQDMNQYDYFNHVSLEGKDIGQRVESVGYEWDFVGENIAWNQDTLDEVIKAWIKSPSHCRMLMSPKPTELGLAKVGKYWVQNFGRPTLAKSKQGT